MNLLRTIARILVGLLFIFSGLVKANDPLGLSYKMKEFFEVWNEGLAGLSGPGSRLLIRLFDFLHEHSLGLAIILITLEILAGLALLLGWHMKALAWLLLVLIVFFTFLTGYAFLSGKFKNCGCFGDCLPISPQTSFLKDLVLTALIVFLFTQRRRIKPLLAARTGNSILLLALLASYGMQAYALQYLPYVDCLPFRKGNNLAEQMKIPAGALPDSFAIRFIYAKNGREYEFSPADLPADLGTYTFRKRIDKLVRKGNAEPAIKGFSLTGSTDTDSTPVILQDPYCLLLFDEAFDQPVSGWIHQSGQLREAARQRHIPLYIATTARDEALEKLRGTPLQDLPVFNCDFTVIRMAARTTPCLYLLQAGTVVDKWGPRQFDKALARVNQLAALSAAANQGTPGQPAPSNP